MALARTLAVGVIGVDGHLVEVEAHLAGGLPGLALIGLPDAALAEARDRIRAAVLNSGQKWPDERITVGLFPATLPKSGSGFDLAMALAILAAAGAVPVPEPRHRVLLGELALDGRVRPVRGVLPAVLAAVDAGVTRVVVPTRNAAEAALVPGAQVEPVPDLRSAIGLLRGEYEPEPVPARYPADGGRAGVDALDLADVAGQSRGRLAVEVAAAGGHHLYLQGPPGGGKTMLADRLPGLLPDLDLAAAIEVTAVHSVAGVLPADTPLVSRPPYRSPHHSATPAALVGAGTTTIRPGLACQAHRGVLFLDEAAEFSRTALDALRQPLESGTIEIARARMTTRFPARFLLVLAANPCPCARARAAGANACECPSAVRRRYQARLSGPLLDRIDLQIEVGAPSRAELRADSGTAESSAVVAQRVAAARTAMRSRLRGTPWRTNAEVPGAVLRRNWPLPPEVTSAADRAYETGSLTARGLDRVLRVAWTLADLEGAGRPGPAQLGLALDLRIPGRSR
ncbi:YifB family Mg chelatase-like AAA ATPase [Frankia sp. CNm7]|uniref:YifB family Mg chelatase-like AAA ATPase n=1 Tax=Frankia nepalensis TaxID=1836974 RepID=A0A937US97_9ACTN|nr:YifB family Mg chelatase-like AAA ATPase [Frankia nepalensis]MBL7497034.1 YifB family Mg chelatase-like AAA ATPase [Frankia nepalensis]MBL7510498.1 YifB family Mg chelatase-like AAA ATPase [Frankia nepalensis]MBL7517074.1 YifB family Mg chelatase-like AAA ATPase [Frankia nepalensis]MBL7628651.1 YifB family Mg chelatase-like AAA ATPase [Frankia nepalensis]